MTDQQLSEIEARAGAATTGPFISCRGDIFAADTASDSGLLVASFSPMIPRCYYNGELFTHAKVDILALVAEVRRMKEICGGGDGGREG